MSLSKQEFSNYIKQFNFRELFNDMGWNNDKTTQPIVVDNTTYILKAVAEKCGLKILTCEVDELPNNEARRKIDTQIKRLFFHYILICIDKKGNQKWIIPIKKSEKREIAILDYASHQVPEFLYQKVSDLTFSFDQEEALTIVDVSKLVNDLFTVNSEKVTKAFYDKFKKEHGAFLQFIKGISDKANQDWYASLMLNRLMFCYFIQKKGFLDSNKNYLRDKLKDCTLRQAQGDKSKVKFYSFYRDFLLVLFHKGLNDPTQSQETKVEIGKIPYLNGGLFDEHELEKTHTGIDIDDKAFERLFDFFDQYEWHLDTSITATGKDINPDVIGYIFEKYINDRANMGAYYTKEDITDYISKNCILPYLFDETKRNYAKAFNADGALWQMVKQSGDLYIYDAVKKGVDEPLPKEIEQGKKDVSKRIDWNTSASLSAPNMALPTEIWREVVDRRNRYTEVKAKIDKGEITAINDFITYNLNIRQFAQDAVESTNDPEYLKHFYKALNSVTIIDPTCGSGAFLFAAMNILEPLYEACIQRMEIFIEEAKDENNYKHLSPELQKSWKSLNHKESWFRQCLAQVKSPEHPNLQYFIYKSIILRNLYGVDIMKEAVEIAKLRLFLKLVATVEADYRKPNLGLEPLPDIDFNIRAGNTLVGFATEAELEKVMNEDLEAALMKNEIIEGCEKVKMTYKIFKDRQLSDHSNYEDTKRGKRDLENELNGLNKKLNQLLHKQASGLKYDTWLKTHQPFHWFAEYYEIIEGNDGFDIVIGNPPYVAMKDVKYIPKNYETLACGDIYALCIERSVNSLLRKDGRIGMIVPISIVSTDGYSTLRKVCQNSKSGYYFSNFGVRPSKLFDGVDKRLTIFIKNNEPIEKCFITKYFRWVSEERDNLFSYFSYQNVRQDYFTISGYPKISSKIEQAILDRLKKQSKSLSHFIVRTSSHKIRYTRKLQYFIQFFEKPPIIYDAKRHVIEPTELKDITVGSEIEKNTLISVLNSNLFFWFFITFSDCRNVNSREILKFPIDLTKMNDDLKKQLTKFAKSLMKDLDKNSVFLHRNDKRAGLLEIQSFQPRASKLIIDEIDTLLAKHYGFTDEELDFIINYDIKYRMGKELESEEEV
jgi:hypothetical protein